MRAVRPTTRRWQRRSRRYSEIGCRPCHPNRTGQRRSPGNRDRATGSRASGPGKQGEAREATDSGFSRTTSTTLSRSWRLSPFNRKMHSTESDSTARTRSISNKQDKGQFSSHFTKLDDRGTRRRARGCRCRPSER